MADAETVPPLEFIFAAHAKVDPALDLGDVGKGGRRIVPIIGGDFSGPQMRGTVLPGGADWQIMRHDGVAELEARYTLRTDDGALIYVRNHALRHGPAESWRRSLRGGRLIRPPTISAALLSLRPALSVMPGLGNASSFAPANANPPASSSGFFGCC